MLTYRYTARNPHTGEKISAELQADSEMNAARLIQDQGMLPLDIKAKGGDLAGQAGRSRRVRTKDRIVFSRQLSTMISAGLPLVQSLRTVQRQTNSKPLQAVLNNVINDVEGGVAFSVALGKHPRVFNDIFISLVAAGEVSGTLDKSLERLALQQEKDAEIMSKVRGAFVYPAVVITVMIAVVAFMLVGVLPRVQELFKTFGNVSLPITTRVLLAMSSFTMRYWWAVLLFVIVAGFLTMRWARSGPGKLVVDRIKLRMPPVGSLFMKLYMARFARTASTLVASGVPLIQVLQVTARAVNNSQVEASLYEATEKVKGGRALSEALQGDPNFLELVPNMIKIGEESGTIETMLAKSADYYEKEVDNQIKTISTIIEPALMIVLGIVALLIIVAVLLPIYQLSGSIRVR